MSPNRLNLGQIQSEIKSYLLKEFLPGEDPEALNDSVGLIVQGILDSISTLKLVSFLEERYGIELQTHELDIDHLNRLSDIAKLVYSKQEKNRSNV